MGHSLQLRAFRRLLQLNRLCEAELWSNTALCGLGKQSPPPRHQSGLERNTSIAQKSPTPVQGFVLLDFTVILVILLVFCLFVYLFNGVRKLVRRQEFHSVALAILKISM